MPAISAGLRHVVDLRARKTHTVQPDERTAACRSIRPRTPHPRRRTRLPIVAGRSVTPDTVRSASLAYCGLSCRQHLLGDVVAQAVRRASLIEPDQPRIRSRVLGRVLDEDWIQTSPRSARESRRCSPYGRSSSRYTGKELWLVTEMSHAQCQRGRRQSFEHEAPRAVGSRDPHDSVPLQDRYVGTADHVPVGR